MPFVSTIIAKLLALQDWYLGQFVDVGVGVSISPNLCYVIPTIEANVNACGQALAGNTTGGWNSFLTDVVDLIPNIVSVLLFTGPFANWTPYIPPTPPTPP
jgi:hypothetical protein